MVQWWKSKQQLKEWLDEVKSNLPLIVDKRTKLHVKRRLKELKKYDKYL